MLDPVSISVAALATMPLGFLWFSSMMFGKTWGRLNKIHPQKLKKGPGVFPFLISFASGFVLAVMIAVLLDALSIQTLNGAWKLTLLLWFAFDFLPGWMRHLFDRRPLELLLINTGHTAANAMLVTWILLQWR